MSTPLRPWMEQLVGRISSAPESIIQAELVYVIRDFCRESLAWRELLQGYNVAPGCSDVDVNPVDGRRECIQVINAYIDGMELEAVPYTRPQMVPGEGTPRAFTCEKGPSIITLLPSPVVEIPMGLSANVALCPKCPEIWMPPHFQRLYFEAILDGTLGRFFMQPNRPFTNERAAAYHLRRYRNKTREAWAHSLRGNTVSAANWTYPSFGV